MKNNNVLYKRILLLIIGLTLTSIGTTLSLKANLGQSSVSALAKNIELLTLIKSGTIISIVNYLCFALQIAILRKDFKLIQCFQLVLTVIFGEFVNFFAYTLPITTNINPTTYPIKLLVLLTGLLISTLGVSLTLKANLAVLPFEGFCNALVLKLNKPFSTVRPILDATIVLASVVLIIAFKLPNVTIREGTIIFTILFGKLVGFYNSKININI